MVKLITPLELKSLALQAGCDLQLHYAIQFAVGKYNKINKVHFSKAFKLEFQIPRIGGYRYSRQLYSTPPRA